MPRKTIAAPGNPARVVGYVRASTDRQDLGPEAQREALARWCAGKGAQLVAVHEELGVSGGTPIEQRTGLLSAVDALQPAGAGVLLVARRDRLARDVVAAAMIERLVERAGARILSCAGEGEGEGPEGLLMRRIVDAFAEYERAVIRGRIRAALAVKKQRGERVGDIPYGYRLAGDGRRLEPEPGEQQVLGVVRQLRATGATLRVIGEQLEGQGLRPRSGGRWHPQTLANISKAL